MQFVSKTLTHIDGQLRDVTCCYLIENSSVSLNKSLTYCSFVNLFLI